MANKKSALPFDSVGGVIAIQRRLVESDIYLSLPAQAKCLMTLLQVHWRNDKPVDYGIREAMAKIPCAKGTARQSFIELIEKGFIDVIDESLFNSRTQSKSRTWKLNWLPYKNLAPTNEWKANQVNRIKNAPSGTATGSNVHPIKVPNLPQGQICTPRQAKTTFLESQRVQI